MTWPLPGDLLLTWDVQFSHHGLGVATLWLAVLTTATGLFLLWYRYGSPAGGFGPTILRWGHVVLGIALLCYVLATYWIVPV